MLFTGKRHDLFRNCELYPVLSSFLHPEADLRIFLFYRQVPLLAAGILTFQAPAFQDPEKTLPGRLSQDQLLKDRLCLQSSPLKLGIGLPVCAHQLQDQKHQGAALLLKGCQTVVKGSSFPVLQEPFKLHSLGKGHQILYREGLFPADLETDPDLVPGKRDQGDQLHPPLFSVSHDPAHLPVGILPYHEADLLGRGYRFQALRPFLSYIRSIYSLSMGAEDCVSSFSMAAQRAVPGPLPIFIHTRTRVVKNLTTLAQNTDSVPFRTVGHFSSDLRFTFPEGICGKSGYLHDASLSCFQSSGPAGSYIRSGASKPRRPMQVVSTLLVSVTRPIYPACFSLSSSAMIFVSW